MRHRDNFRRLILLVGARTPSLLPYQDQLDEWLARWSGSAWSCT